MIVLRGSKHEMSAAAQVSSQVGLIDIALTDVRARNTFDKLADRNQPIRIQCSDPVGKPELTDRHTLLVRTKIAVMGRVEEKDGKNEHASEASAPVLHIEVEFTAEFEIPPGEIPQEIQEVGFPAFAKLNGPYICMPYLRQEVSNIAAQMRLGLPPLPILKIQPEEEKPAVAEEGTAKRPSRKVAAKKKPK